MAIPFSQRPGRHERHLKRKIDNLLMPRPIVQLDDGPLLEAQRLDHEELLVFLPQLREAVRQAVDLGPREDSQVILDLKAELEQLYETAAGLADDHSGNKMALRQLISVIMSTIRKNAQGDSLAMQELEQEEAARSQHFHLLESPLVADLIHPRSLIEVDELVPILLTDEEPQVREALVLFDADQRRQLHQQAQALLTAKGLLDEAYAPRLGMIQP